ncbi:MAG TPA: PQQ-dependent sugar dehydrogenase [Acidimicrobiia bacterium]
MAATAVLGLALVGACSSGSATKTTSPVPLPPTSSVPTTSTTARPGPSSTRPASTPNLASVRVALTPVVSGLASPIALAWRAHDTHMFVAEQRGRVRIVDANGHLSPTPVLTVGPLSSRNEEGLLGITFSPDGSKLYVDYTDPANNTHVDEYAMRGEQAVASTRRQILVQQQPYSNHKGGEVITGPDGMLYIGLGDRGSEDDPNHVGQNLGTLLSKILRIDPAASAGAAYSVPADNPFVGRAGIRPETWMWGLRNPWRFSFDRKTGDLWIGDVGQDAYEEVDFAPAGAKGINWGWSAREGFHAFRGSTPTGARDPLLETRHSDGTCAIVGGYVYRGRAIPALDGVYVFGDDCRPNLVGVVADQGRVVAQRDLGPTVSALTTFGEDANGELYAVARGGTVFRITPG